MAKAATVNKLQEALLDLSVDDLDAVAKFIAFLRASAAAKKRSHHLKQDWAGALSEFADKYTSIDLQHQASSWRNE